MKEKLHPMKVDLNKSEIMYVAVVTGKLSFNNLACSDGLVSHPSLKEAISRYIRNNLEYIILDYGYDDLTVKKVVFDKSCDVAFQKFKQQDSLKQKEIKRKKLVEIEAQAAKLRKELEEGKQ